ncbi:MAG: hypothetical protein R3A47_04485 [Polyangiales bacterium]
MNSALKYTVIAMATAALGFSTAGCKKDADAPEATEATSGAEAAAADAEAAAADANAAAATATEAAAEASCGEGSCG